MCRSAVVVMAVVDVGYVPKLRGCGPGAMPHPSILHPNPTAERAGTVQDVGYVAAPDRYDSMPYRRCGRSGLQLPAISLGLWQNFGD